MTRWLLLAAAAMLVAATLACRSSEEPTASPAPPSPTAVVERERGETPPASPATEPALVPSPTPRAPGESEPARGVTPTAVVGVTRQAGGGVAPTKEAQAGEGAAPTEAPPEPASDAREEETEVPAAEGNEPESIADGLPSGLAANLSEDETICMEREGRVQEGRADEIAVRTMTRLLDCLAPENLNYMLMIAQADNPEGLSTETEACVAGSPLGEVFRNAVVPLEQEEALIRGMVVTEIVSTLALGACMTSQEREAAFGGSSRSGNYYSCLLDSLGGLEPLLEGLADRDENLLEDVMERGTACIALSGTPEEEGLAPGPGLTPQP